MNLFRWLRQQPNQTSSSSSSFVSTPRAFYEDPQAFAARGLPEAVRPWAGLHAIDKPFQLVARALNPSRYVSVEGLRPGQRPSEGVIELVNDSFRFPSSFYYPDVRSKNFKLGRGSFGSVERYVSRNSA